MSASTTSWAMDQPVADPYAKLLLIYLSDCADNGSLPPSVIGSWLTAGAANFMVCHEALVADKLGYLIDHGFIKEDLHVLLLALDEKERAA